MLNTHHVLDVLLSTVDVLLSLIIVMFLELEAYSSHLINTRGVLSGEGSMTFSRQQQVKES